jgi:hypothetical protein
VKVIAGQVTAMNRDARTLAFGPTIIRVSGRVSLVGIVVGSSVTVVFEGLNGRLVAVEIQQP